MPGSATDDAGGYPPRAGSRHGASSTAEDTDRTYPATTRAATMAVARAGQRGPFEVLLRRATYGRPPPAVPAASATQA